MKTSDKIKIKFKTFTLESSNAPFKIGEPVYSNIPQTGFRRITVSTIVPYNPYGVVDYENKFIKVNNDGWSIIPVGEIDPQAVLLEFESGYKLIFNGTATARATTTPRVDMMYPENTPTGLPLTPENLYNIIKGQISGSTVPARRLQYSGLRNLNINLLSPDGNDLTSTFLSSSYAKVAGISRNNFYMPNPLTLINYNDFDLYFNLQFNGNEENVNELLFYGLYPRVKPPEYDPVDDFLHYNFQEVSFLQCEGALTSIPHIDRLIHLHWLIPLSLYLKNEKGTNDLEIEDTPGEGGGNSGPGGGGGNFNNDSDLINVPQLPSQGAQASGMVDIYQMTLVQTRALADYLWSDVTEFVENFSKLFSDPMDALISMTISPAIPALESTQTISICKFQMGTVAGQPLSSQYVQVDCGSIFIEPYWGNALDFSPYTKMGIFLPFIGTQSINADDCMNKKIGVIYNIDVLTGACCAFITVNNSVMYSFAGNCITQIPLSGKNALEVYSSVLNAVTNTALAVGTGGASAPITEAQGTAAALRTASTAVTSGLSVMGSKESIQRGGSISSASALLGGKVPFITVTRALQSLPVNFKKFKGYPSNITAVLGSLTGYTEISYCRLENIPATENEITEIYNLLFSGIII